VYNSTNIPPDRGGAAQAPSRHDTGERHVPRASHHSERRTSISERRASISGTVKSVATVVAMVIAITVIGKVLHPYFDLVNIALLYLLPVLFAAVRWGLIPSIVASLFGILSFDYFFVPPVMSFSVSDIRHLINFALFLVVALVTGSLAAKLRREVAGARQRERRTAALYSLSQKIAVEFDIHKALRAVVETVSHNVESESAILTPGIPFNALGVAAFSGNNEFLLDQKERTAARLCYEHGQQTMSVTHPTEPTRVIFMPITDGVKNVGVLALRMAGDLSLSLSQQEDLKAFTSLAALAITRARLTEEAEQAKWLAESEKLHRSLLNAVSHDLRTPLSSIIGAVTGLLGEGDVYEPEAKATLLRTIKEGAQRMNRFVTNLLDMARLESGILRPHKDWCDMVDILGVALNEVLDILPPPRVGLDVPETLPLVKADFGLIEQVLINLLENSVKYSPPESPISVSLVVEGDELRLVVADVGPSIPDNDLDRIFDKFYRLRTSQHVTGTGLGLSICKGIVEAHGGRIWAEPNEPTGNRFLVALPLSMEKEPPVPEGAQVRVG
jgi:two-component system, OmpR family, sensor histidine kinase KdpD